MHYELLLLHDNDSSIEWMMRPYDENRTDCEPWVYMTRDEVIEDTRKYADPKSIRYNLEHGSKMYILRNDDINRNCVPEEYFDFRVPTEEDIANAEKLLENDDEWWLNLATKLNADDSSVYFSDDGDLMTTWNEDAKWDWYVTGGRWDCEIPVKDSDDKVNECALDDIDFSINEKDYDYAKRWFEVIVDGAPLDADEDPEEFKTFYRKEYLRERYGDADGYAKKYATFSTYAILTPDGEWHAPKGYEMKDDIEFDEQYMSIVSKWFGKGITATLIDYHI